MRIPTLLAAVLLAGCPADEKAAEPTKPAELPVETPAAPPAVLKFDELKAQAQNITLVPSPAEMQRALEKAGISAALSGLVPDRQVKMDVENKDVVAVRTGVVLADAMLTVKEAPKEKLTARLTSVKQGLASLGGGADIQATLDDLIARINNDGLSRDELVKELDELHGAVVPEIEYEAGEKVVPLLQAGSWLEGSNLVAGAILTANKPEAGTSLLRQPQVVTYFQKYVEVAGPGKAPDEVLQQLDATLKKLGEIASKPSLTADDVKEVKSQTDSVLALL